MRDGAGRTCAPLEDRESKLTALQGVVHQRLGQCLIRLQQYELLLKDFVARAQVEGPADSTAAMHATGATNVSKQTLGKVMGAFLETVLSEPAWDADGFPPAASRLDQATWISSGFIISFSDEDVEGVKADLTELVDLRNMLVHGFVTQHDLESEAGCIAATAELDHSGQVIDQHLQTLRDWYTEMLDLSRALEEMLTDPNFFDELVPTASQGDVVANNGPATTTVLELLRHAERELAVDGWTRLDDAIAFIQRISPERTPGRYGSVSWRQVLHEARPVFSVRREASRHEQRGGTWYRSALPTKIESSADA